MAKTSLLENGRNILGCWKTAENQLLENGRNFGRFPTNTVDCLKMAETVPKSFEKRHCWKMAEILAVFQQLKHFI